MNPKQERDLLLLTYLIDNGLRPVSEILSEWGISEDEDFQIENAVTDLIKDGYLEQASDPMNGSQPENITWKLTEKGRGYLKELAREKYDEKNKIPVYIWAVIIFVAILTFMKLFPRMFH
jgi:hypothetical protein